MRSTIITLLALSLPLTTHARPFPFDGPDPWAELEAESKKHRVPPVRPPAPEKPPQRAAAPATKPKKKAAPAPVKKPAPTTAVASIDQPIDLAAVDFALMSEALHVVTNEAREAHGVPPVEPHPLLVDAAEGHAKRMVNVGFFDHFDPEPSRASPDLRARNAGVANPKIAENIATQVGLRIEPDQKVYHRGDVIAVEPGGDAVPAHTYRSFARAVTKRWLDSPGHRRNLLAEEGLQVGCAAAPVQEGLLPRFMVVQVFQWFEPVQRPETLGAKR